MSADQLLKHLFVVRPYSMSDESSVRDLLRRCEPNQYRYMGEWLSLLQDLHGPEWTRPPAAAMISWSASSMSGLALAEAYRDMPDRWMLLCLIVDPAFRKQGQATTLLHCLEREVRSRGGRSFGVELPSSELWDDSGRFLLKRGYQAYDGMGLAKRFPLSRYFLKDLRKTAARTASGSETSPPQSRAER